MTETKTAIGQEVDVAVVGSGFGGAAVACRLAQAGRTVAILEQGKEYPTGRGEYDATGRGISTVRHGHFWVDLGFGMNVVRGIGVGGGSLHYFGVRLRTDPDIFENPRWPRILNRRTLDPYYDLAGDMLQAAPTLPNPVLGATRPWRSVHGRGAQLPALQRRAPLCPDRGQHRGGAGHDRRRHPADTLRLLRPMHPRLPAVAELQGQRQCAGAAHAQLSRGGAQHQEGRDLSAPSGSDRAADAGRFPARARHHRRG